MNYTYVCTYVCMHMCKVYWKTWGYLKIKIIFVLALHSLFISSNFFSISFHSFLFVFFFFFVGFMKRKYFLIKPYYSYDSIHRNTHTTPYTNFVFLYFFFSIFLPLIVLIWIHIFNHLLLIWLPVLIILSYMDRSYLHWILLLCVAICLFVMSEQQYIHVFLLLFLQHTSGVFNLQWFVVWRKMKVKTE